ncbi:MAG: hypothetical protein ACKVTZ_07615 [Bacteroidia bacterium]
MTNQTVFNPLIAEIVEASPEISGDALEYFCKGLTLEKFSKRQVIISSGKKQKNSEKADSFAH